jgi:hypothetical protein
MSEKKKCSHCKSEDTFLEKEYFSLWKCKACGCYLDKKKPNKQRKCKNCGRYLDKIESITPPLSSSYSLRPLLPPLVPARIFIDTKEPLSPLVPAKFINKKKRVSNKKILPLSPANLK